MTDTQPSTLPSEFTVGEYRFQQLRRDGNLVLWKRTATQGKDYFQIVKARKDNEALPLKSGFFRTGATFASLLQAQRKFAELVEESK